MHDYLFWCLTISEDGEGRFREPKMIYEECELVRKAIPSSTKYKNKWAVTIFSEWQISRSVKAPVLDPGGLFKNYDSMIYLRSHGCLPTLKKWM